MRVISHEKDITGFHIFQQRSSAAIGVKTNALFELKHPGNYTPELAVLSGRIGM